MKRLVLLIAFMAGMITETMAIDIVVKPGDNLYDALQAVRNMRRLAKQPQAYNIILRGGEYVLDRPLVLRPEDGGRSNASTLTIKSATGERAVISGSANVTGWKRQGKLWVAQAPRINGRTLQVRQMWVNGRKALRATQFGEYKLERMLDFNTDKRTITIPTPSNIKQLKSASLLEMLVHQRWAIAILRVKDMKVLADGKTEVSFLEPESHLEFLHPWPQPIIDGEKGSSSFCLQNALCLVDEEGEWYEDESGQIYYYPHKGEDMTTADVRIPRLERLLTIEGSPQRKVDFVNIEDIDFQYAAWNCPSVKGHVTLQGGFAVTEAYKLLDAGLPWNANLENQAWIERPVAAVQVAWGKNVNFRSCGFSHLAATALDYRTGMKHSQISSNRFTDIGGTAILVGSFAEGATEVHNPLVIGNEEYTEHIRIQNNSISDATNEDWGAVGIGAGYVRHTVITGNELNRLNYSGICVGWGWTAHDTGMCCNEISNNQVSDFARMLYDAGGIYTLSNQPESQITNNTIKALGEAPYATNDRGFYIYLDEATDGYTISGNKCDAPKFGDNKPGPKVIWK